MKLNPITELRGQLAAFCQRCRAMRWLGALFHVGVSLEILTDIEHDRFKQERDAHAAEVAVQEARATLRRICADGFISKTELPQLRQALRQIHRSERLDHSIGERAHA